VLFRVKFKLLESLSPDTFEISPCSREPAFRSNISSDTGFALKISYAGLVDNIFLFFLDNLVLLTKEDKAAHLIRLIPSLIKRSADLFLRSEAVFLHKRQNRLFFLKRRRSTIKNRETPCHKNGK
jgi:hypothetical protein